MTRSFELRIVWLITLITLINYFDRSAISFAIGPIEKELGLNSAQFGLMAAGFGLGYFVMVFLAGILVERFNCTRIWAYGAICWSLATMAMGLAEGFISIFILRVILGVAEGIHFPALLKTIADWLNPAYRARSISLGLLGVPLASLIGAPLITYLIEGFGWRWMFFVLGSLGFIWAVIWLWSFRGKANPRRGVFSIPGDYLQTSIQFDIPWKLFFQNRAFLINCCVYFVFGYVVFFALIWLPGYLEQTHQVTLKNTGFMVMAPWLLSSILMLCGGWISDQMMRREPTSLARTIPIGVGMLLASASFFLLLASSNLSFDLWMMSLGLGFAMFVNAPIYAFNADLFPYHVGPAQGIASCFFALAGIVSPSITGLLVQISGSFQSAIFLVAALCAAASFFAFSTRLLKN